MAEVFIYGTLKRTFPLHEKGLTGARFLGLYQTTKPYPLYMAKPFFGPMMLDKPGDGTVVEGELFEADDERLMLLDGLEDVGAPGSFRSSVTVEAKGGGDPREAIFYAKDETWLITLQSDLISDYQDRRFIPPWER